MAEQIEISDFPDDDVLNSINLADVLAFEASCSSAINSGDTSTITTKKRLLSSPSIQEHSTKQLTLDEHILLLHGFTKVPLPPPPAPTKSQSPPTISHHLYRSSSDLQDSIISVSSESFIGSSSSNSKSAENAKQSPVSLQPLPFRRTVPVPRVLHQSRSPSEISAGKCSSSVFNESPDTKRLKKMKEQMRQISQWCEVIVNESEENNNHNHEEPLVTENEEVVTEESLAVEKIGEWLVINFKCCCNKGYLILLSGVKCFYKRI